jgi:hypothetical protein
MHLRIRPSYELAAMSLGRVEARWKTETAALGGGRTAKDGPRCILRRYTWIDEPVMLRATEGGFEGI